MRPLILIVGFLLLNLHLTELKGDVATPGTKSVEYRILLKNGDQFPDYLFYVLSTTQLHFEEGWRSLLPGEAVSVFHSNYVHFKGIFAVSKDNQDKNRFSNIYRQVEGQSDRILQESLMQSGVFVGHWDWYRNYNSGTTVSDPIESITDEFEIITIDNRGITLRLNKVIYEYVDGLKEELTAQDNQRPPRQRPVVYWYTKSDRIEKKDTWFWAVPLSAAAGLVLIWLYRKRNRRKAG